MREFENLMMEIIVDCQLLTVNYFLLLARYFS